MSKHGTVSWSETLESLKNQLSFATYNTWLKNTTLLQQSSAHFLIGVQTPYAKDWLENRLSSKIEKALRHASGLQAVTLEFEVVSGEVLKKPNPLLSQHITPALNVQRYDTDRNGHQQMLNGYNADHNGNGHNGRSNHLTEESAPKKKTMDKNAPELGANLKISTNYTFDRFVVGSSNRLAHAASLAVAEKPGKAYNPLFLYGGVGLGKTHLLQAIAHTALAHEQKVIYVSSETFTNDFINAIRRQTTEAFRAHYRNTDFLLIDDIQFIAGKESTQEEFFHTFNDIHSKGGQIVLTSDRLPKAIPTLEARLSSRFEWGLLADIQPPDLETRLAILRFKGEEVGARVPSDVMEFIARRAQNNIRELEGALNKVVAHAALREEQITLEVAQKALENLVPLRAAITVDMVLDAVVEVYEVSREDIIGNGRSKKISSPRQMVMYLSREETKASLPQIGEVLGGRDHTTIIYGYDKMKRLVEQDENYRRTAMQIREILYQKVS